MKSESTSPRVLVIDDDIETEESVAAGLRLQGMHVDVRLPHAVTEDDIRRSDVIAIDQFYDWSGIRHPDEAIFWPRDGLAIASVVAGHLRRLDHHAAILLRTGELARLAKHLPAGMREPLVAAQYNIDWIIGKEDQALGAKILQLGKAVRALTPLALDPRSWNEGYVWLALPNNVPWTEAALADVQVSRPPENVVATYTAGTAWLRWFAQKVLPFPGFLLPDYWAATLLRMDLRTFTAVAEAETRLGHAIRECRYGGHLNLLAQRRWWRAGFEALVDHCLADASPELGEVEALEEQFSILHGSAVSVIQTDNPVVAIDADYRVTGVIDATSGVRLAPDLWPVFSDEPWADIEDVEHDPTLRLMVARGDRGRV